MLKWSEIDASTKAKQEILEGASPLLSWPAKDGCPLERGDEVGISFQKARDGSEIPQVWISVTAVGRTKTGRHRIEYTVHDERGWYLDQSLGYTRSPGRSIDPEAAVLDPAVQAGYAKEAEARRKERREKEDPRKRERRVISLFKARLADLSVDGRRDLCSKLEGFLEAETDG